MMTPDKVNYAGRIHVWGGPLDETAFCTVDSYGTFDSGPEVPGQDQIEDQIQDGEESGVTDAGTSWEYVEHYSTGE